MGFRKRLQIKFNSYEQRQRFIEKTWLYLFIVSVGRRFRIKGTNKIDIVATVNIQENTLCGEKLGENKIKNCELI